MKILRSLILFTIASLCTITAFAQDNNEFRWKGRIEEGRTLEIKGVNGDVRAEETAGREVEVVAVKRGGRSNAEDVRIEVVEHANGITVCALYPQRDGQLSKCEPGKGGQNSYKNNTSVTFTVRVPSGVHFTGRTVNGDVTATSLDGNVEATTVNGDVSLSTSGYAQASTINGSLNVACGRADWTDKLEFNTINGSIEITLPDTAQTEINASLINGSITTDLPLFVKGEIDKRHLKGILGLNRENPGGRKLRLNTINGSIRVKGGRGVS